MRIIIELHSTFLLIIASCLFRVGFVQAKTDIDASDDGLIIGIVSAAAWGMGSIGATQGFSNLSSLFAAMFAAMSLGPRTPAPDICKVSNGLMWNACEIRVSIHRHF